MLNTMRGEQETNDTYTGDTPLRFTKTSQENLSLSMSMYICRMSLP